jgi:hypothetical protein
MSDDIIRIERLENGYEVSVIDEKIQEKNHKPNSMWDDPWRCYAFETSEAVLKFLGTVIDTIKTPPKPDAVFAKAFEDASTAEETKE